jgi:Tol biopolymer transport system component
MLGALLIGHLLPSGGQVAYISSFKRQVGVLRVLDLTYGLAVTLESEIPSAARLYPSPDGKYIALLTAHANQRTLHIINTDGSSVQRVESDHAWALAGWLPDSARLAVLDSTGRILSGLNVHNLQYETLLEFEALVCAFALSPNGRFFAFQISYANSEQLCVGIAVMHLDSGTIQQYLSNISPVFPIWSPDSHSLAIYNNFSIFVIPDVSQDAVLEILDARMRVPISTLAWSPDSGQVVFSADISFDVFVAPTAPMLGAAENRTPFPSHEFYPIWLPSGGEIAFISDRDTAAGEVYVMNADGTNTRRLTFNIEAESNLVWLP